MQSLDLYLIPRPEVYHLYFPKPHSVVIVTGKSSNDCGESSWSENITTRVFSTLGVEHNTGNLGISITPNPNNGVFKLQVATPSSGTISFSIINASGARVFEKKDVQTNGQYTENMQIKLSSGTYTLKVESDLGSGVSRFVVK